MSTVLTLGKFAFEIDCQDDQLKACLESLFPSRAVAHHRAPATVHDESGDVRSIVNIALRHHEDCLWFDAAALIAPGGQKVLFAGASSSGKSTTTIALALGYGWKVLSEDITLFDPSTDELLSFASPISLKPGTFERLQAAKLSPPPLILNEWIPVDGMAAPGESVSATLDLAFFFNVINQTEPEPISAQQITPGEFLRLVLPISNLLHSTAGMDKLSQYLAPARCYRLSGGSLTERLSKINQILSVT